MKSRPTEKQLTARSKGDAQKKSDPLRKLVTELIAVEDLVPSSRNARRHGKRQIDQLSASIAEYGFINPIIVDESNRVLAGHARLEAVKAAGMPIVPVIRVTHLTENQKLGYRLADNKLAEGATWDFEIVAEDLTTLSGPGIQINIESIGFANAEIDTLIGKHANSKIKEDEADHQPAIDPDRPIVSRQGDLWHLDQHRLLCGDARELEDCERLLDCKEADMVITDPPYNVKVDGFVCGLGSVSHEEFAMGSGEMGTAEFRSFLATTTSNLVEATRDGSIHFIFMDWRHIDDLLAAARPVYADLKAICVWNKSNGGMGSLYRSKHEFVAVFKNGTAPHINNIELGKHGRNRTTVWDCPGVNSFGAERDNLAIHPTVKPVKLIEDAILDCSNRNDRVLDVFCGSGTTLIAAERVGRIGFGIEYDPKYVDAALRRFRTITGIEPVRAADGATLKSLE
jgi:DNA modification methylase